MRHHDDIRLGGLGLVSHGKPICKWKTTEALILQDGQLNKGALARNLWSYYATASNYTTSVPGGNTALQVVNTAAYGNCGYNIYKPLNSYTICGWLKGGAGSYGATMYLYTNHSIAGYGRLVEMNIQLKRTVFGGGNSYTHPATTPASGWQFFVAAGDMTYGSTWYSMTNGKVGLINTIGACTISTVPTQNAPSSTTAVTQITDFSFSPNYSGTGSTCYFSGCALYGRRLTDAEILYLYNSGNGRHISQYL